MPNSIIITYSLSHAQCFEWKQTWFGYVCDYVCLQDITIVHVWLCLFAGKDRLCVYGITKVPEYGDLWGKITEFGVAESDPLPP